MALIVVSIWGQYTRRERVQGYLESDSGTASLLVSDAGIISELLVKEGDSIEAGMPIARITVDRANIVGTSGGDAVMRELGTRKKMLEREREQTTALGKQELEQIRQRIEQLKIEIKQADREIELQQQRLASSEIIAKRYQELAQDQQFISDIVVRQKFDDVTDQKIKVQALRRQRATLEKDLAAARSEEPSITLKTKTQLEQLNRQVSELQQNVVEQDIQKEAIVRAPIAGTITNIALSQGQTVAADTPLATILPVGSALHAELLVPTRAIGFVRPGQEVSLRYEAFPYERFGQYRGTVLSVGKTVWSQGEKVGPMVVREPTYRIAVRLEQQKINAGDQSIPLRSGMMVSADLLLEKRSLLEWLFQPVFQLRERLK